MEPTTQTRSGREVIEAIVQATERQDPQAARPYLHPEIVAEWPQSGERFIGPDNAIGAMTATETKPELAGEPSRAVLRLLRPGESMRAWMRVSAFTPMGIGRGEGIVAAFAGDDGPSLFGRRRS